MTVVKGKVRCNHPEVHSCLNLNYKLMESDICRLIFVHSVESLGQSDQWRAEDKVVHLSLLSTK